MKKILIVTPFFVPAYSYGGIVKVAYDQARGLVDEGFAVTVVTTDVLDTDRRSGPSHEEIDGISVIRFSNISNYLAKFHNLYLPRKMDARLKKNITHYDIVHIHDIYNLPTYRAATYAQRYHIPYFIQPHGVLSDVRIESRKSVLKRRILSSMRPLFDAATGFFALTGAERHEIQHVTSNPRIYDLPNTIDTTKFSHLKKENLRKKFWLSPTTKVIVFFGRIQYIKGLDIALEILAQLDTFFSDRRFLIIGPDEGEQSRLVALSETLGIDEKIIRYGPDDTPKKYSLLAGADVFFFTSRAEGFPMTLLEALACGLPVVISEGCRFPELAHSGAGSILPDTATALEKAHMLSEVLRRDTPVDTHHLLKKYDKKGGVERLIGRYGF